jgi:hypothetical protein
MICRTSPTGLIGIDNKFSMVPRRFRVTESAVKISMVMVKMVPTSPAQCSGATRRIVTGVGAI